MGVFTTGVAAPRWLRLDSRLRRELSFLKYILPHISIILVVIAYLFAGAALFLRLEEPVERIQRNQGLSDFKSKLTELETKLYKIVNSSGDEPVIITKSKMRIELRKILRKWDEFSKRYEVKASDDWDAEELKGRWTFSEAVLFAFTLITTIGYGNVTPSTVTGRIVCIFYGLLGIPLTMIAIANTGKFFGEALAYGNQWIKNYCLRTWCWIWRARSRTRPHQSESSPKSGEAAANNNVNDFDLDAEPSMSTISVQLLLFVFFTYMMIGASFLPQYEEMDFFTACYFCFISITTVGFGDIYPRQHDFLFPTLLYLTVGLALTTMAIEVSAEYLLKIHYIGTSIRNAKSALIRFGNKIMTVGDLVHAIGRQYGVPEAEIKSVEKSLDTFVSQEIVKKEIRKEEKKKERKKKEKLEKDLKQKRRADRYRQWLTRCCGRCCWKRSSDQEPLKQNGRVDGHIIGAGLVFHVNEPLRFIDDDTPETLVNVPPHWR